MMPLSPGLERFFARVYDMTSFAVQVPVRGARPPLHLGEFLRQCYVAGVTTLPIITLTGAITGVVFTQQSRPSLEAFGAVSWLPSLVTVALVRSLAPLVTALICAGKVGSSIGAEIGSMKVTEQIDALEVSAVSPFDFLVVTRVIATTAMTPVLAAYFALVAFLGSFANVYLNEGTSWTAFVWAGFSTITPLDVWSALGRSIFFGFLIGVIATFSGLRTERGTAGVGIAANTSVVHSMLAVFIGEIFFVQVIDLIRRFS